MRLHERVGSRLKLRDLRLILAVAEQRSMAKAAVELNLTQSGVSRAVADLEGTLGVRLFDRTARGVEPTEYGRALLRGGVAIFDDLRRSVEEIEHIADPAAGELRLGCTEPMSWGIVPAIIDRLVQRHPRLTFQVVQGAPATLRFRDLQERRIELVIGAISGPVPADDVDAEILFDERRFVVAGEQSPWAKRRKLKLSDLVDTLWTIPPPDSMAREALEDAFRTQGLPPPRVSVVNFSMPLHTALLAGGRFLSFFPGSMLRFSAKRMSLKRLPIDFPVRPAPVGIMTSKARTISPVARCFIETAREVVKPLAEWR